MSSSRLTERVSHENIVHPRLLKVIIIYKNKTCQHIKIPSVKFSKLVYLSRCAKKNTK